MDDPPVEPKVTEDELQQALSALAERYRNPADPPLERMWAGIEARAFDVRMLPFRRRARWARLLAYAAVLAIGLGIGFFVGRSGPDQETTLGPGLVQIPPSETPALEASTPFVGVATDYLEHVTALMIAVAGDLRTSAVIPTGTVSRAQDLLSTTRLLLDSDPADPALLDLLEDLELVLAQVVRLPATRGAPDAALIRQTLDQRDVLPRLTVLLADSRVSQ